MDIIDRFLDKVFRSRLDRHYRHRNVGMTGYENDTKGDLSATKFPHEFDAIRAGHPYVSYDAATSRSPNRSKEAVGRLARLDCEPEYAEHFAECVADRFMIIDSKDRRAGHHHIARDCSSGSENWNSVAPARLVFLRKGMHGPVAADPQGDSYVQQLACEEDRPFSRYLLNRAGRDCAAADEQRPESALRTSIGRTLVRADRTTIV
jgi:hypothetical protein